MVSRQLPVFFEIRLYFDYSVIRAGLVWGKLSQNTQSLFVTRATSRTFGREQWELLEKRLLAWKSGLAGVLEVVANAKRVGGHAPAQQAQAASA